MFSSSLSQFWNTFLTFLRKKPLYLGFCLSFCSSSCQTPNQSPFSFDTNFYFMYLLEPWSCIVGWPWTPCSPISTFQELRCTAACSSGYCLFLDDVRDWTQSLMHVCSCKCVHSWHFILMESDNMVLFIQLLSFSVTFTRFVHVVPLITTSFLLPNSFYL